MKSIETRLAGRIIWAALAVMAATLFAAQPMSWEEYLALTRGRSPHDGIGRFRFEGLEKTVYYDAPHALEQGSACEIAVVLVHGWGGGIRRAAAMALVDVAAAKVATGSIEARCIALVRREMFDPLANRVCTQVASIGVEKELARNRASKKANLVPVRIMPEGNGHLVGDGTRKLFG